MSNSTNFTNFTGSTGDAGLNFTGGVAAACYLLPDDEFSWEEMGNCCTDYGIVSKPFMVIVIACLTTLLMDILISYAYWWWYRDLLPFFMIAETSSLVFYYTIAKILVELVLIVIRFMENKETETEAGASNIDRLFGFYWLASNGVSLSQFLILFLKSWLINSTRWELLQIWASKLQQKEKQLRKYKDKQVVQAIQCEVTKGYLLDHIDDLLSELSNLKVIDHRDASNADLENIEFELRNADIVTGMMLPLFKQTSDRWMELLERFPHSAHDAIYDYFLESIDKFNFENLMEVRDIIMPIRCYHSFMITIGVFDWHPTAYQKIKRTDFHSSNLPMLHGMMEGVGSLYLDNKSGPSSKQLRFNKRLIESFTKSGFALRASGDSDKIPVGNEKKGTAKVEGKKKQISASDDIIEENKVRLMVWLLHRIAVKLGKAASVSRFNEWLANKTGKDGRNGKSFREAIAKEDKEYDKQINTWGGNIMKWEPVVKQIVSIETKQAAFLELDKGIPNPAFDSKLLQIFAWGILMTFLPWCFSYTLGGLVIIFLGPAVVIYVAYKLVRCYIDYDDSYNPGTYKIKSRTQKGGSSGGSFETGRLRSTLFGFSTTNNSSQVKEADDEKYLHAFNIANVILKKVIPTNDGDDDGRTPGPGATIELFRRRHQRESTRRSTNRQALSITPSPSPVLENVSFKKSASERFSIKKAAQYTSMIIQDTQEAVSEGIYRRDICSKLLIILAAVFLVALVVFILIHSAVAFYLIVYQGVPYADAFILIRGSFPWEEYLDCTFDAFEKGDAVGIFEFIALL